MDELVQQVSAKTGLSAEVSREAAKAVLSILKEKLPAPIAGQIESFMAGKGSLDDLGGLGGLTKGLGGLFGS
jgi:hypothetical protein